MSAYQCAIHEWCQEEQPEHETDYYHYRRLADAAAGDADDAGVGLSVVHYEQPGEDEWSFSFWMPDEWYIRADTATIATEIDKEFADLRSIVDQLEANVRAFHQRHIERSTAHTGTTKETA